MFTCSGSYRSEKKQKSLSPPPLHCSQYYNNNKQCTADFNPSTAFIPVSTCSRIKPKQKLVNQHCGVLNPSSSQDNPNIVETCLNDLVHNVSGSGVQLRANSSTLNRRESVPKFYSTKIISPPSSNKHPYAKLNVQKTCSTNDCEAIDYSTTIKTEPIEDKQDISFHNSCNYARPSTFKTPHTSRSISARIKICKKENYKNIVKSGKTQTRFANISYEHKLRDRKQVEPVFGGPCTSSDTESSQTQSSLLRTDVATEQKRLDSKDIGRINRSESPTLRSDRIKHMQLAAELIQMISSFTNPTLITWLEYFTNFCELNRLLLSDMQFSNLQTLYQRLAEALAEPMGLLLMEKNFEKCVGISRRLQSVINRHLVSFMSKK